MTQYAWQVSEPTPAIRAAKAATWAYFVTTLAIGVGFTVTNLLTDWAFAQNYGDPIMFISGLGCVIWYPMAQLIAFRAPAGSWEGIGFLALINILLLAGLLMVADGALFQSALAFLVAAFYIIGRWRQTKREAAQASP